MGVMPPKPMRESAEEVVLSRADWEALLEALEDAEDVAAVTAARAEDAVWSSALPRGRATTFPQEVVSAELDGAHPLTAKAVDLAIGKFAKQASRDFRAIHVAGSFAGDH